MTKKELQQELDDWKNGVLAYKCFECGNANTPIYNINLRGRLKDAEEIITELVNIIEDTDARKQIDSFTAQPARLFLKEIK